MSRAANSRCSYAKRLLELTFACVSHEGTSNGRRGGEERLKVEKSILRIEGVAVGALDDCGQDYCR